MNNTLKIKLEQLCERFEEIGHLLSDPDVMGDQNKFRELSIEYSTLEPVKQNFDALQAAQGTLADGKEMLSDPEMADMAKEEIAGAEAEIERIEAELQVLLLPKDPNDDRNVYLEIRAGTGGDEAAIFAGDLLRMYTRYAESQRWKLDILSESASEQGGYKEVITLITGKGAYSRLKFESGAHRVQRVPETESQGRVHTSAATVVILPEFDEVEDFDINPADLRIDTFRSSGAGGQHVNTTDSAIRITHLPTGIVVECQDERSQHKNKAKAMAALHTKIMDVERAKQKSEETEQRRELVGSGDRSDRIRTYNYPQSRVTDHRINLTLYKLDEIMEGALDEVITPLTQEYQADQLAALQEG